MHHNLSFKYFSCLTHFNITPFDATSITLSPPPASLNSDNINGLG
ncbi:hypothetical protein BN128_2230 [Cronobacter sakazakii 696]|nr:hypothetical protein BN128_2230 [Cronobacter sakazakii 696]